VVWNIDPTKERTERVDRKDPDMEEVPDRPEWTDRDFPRHLSAPLSTLDRAPSSNESGEDGDVGEEASEGTDDVFGDRFSGLPLNEEALGLMGGIDFPCRCDCPSNDFGCTDIALDNFPRG
jgi:hypothetical protein